MVYSPSVARIFTDRFRMPYGTGITPTVNLELRDVRKVRSDLRYPADRPYPANLGYPATRTRTRSRPELEDLTLISNLTKYYNN